MLSSLVVLLMEGELSNGWVAVISNEDESSSAAISKSTCGCFSTN